MDTTRAQILAAIADGPRSGPELADRLGISRAAVWKHIETLRVAGFGVESREGGYELVEIPEYGGPAVEFGLDAPYRVEYRETVASTNDVARELAASGEADVVVLADEQTGGRGRRDRAWHSPSGGVWMSVLLRPTLPSARVPLLTLAAAVAVVRSVREVGVEATIKWPNDVLAVTDEGNEAKLAGILTEMAGESAQVSWVVVGIGINANVDSTEVGPGATTLRELVGDVNRRELVQDLLSAFHELSRNPNAIIPAWSEHASTIGREVRIEMPSGVLEGRAKGVTDVGALVVETPDGAETVHTGDCEHLQSL